MTFDHINGNQAAVRILLTGSAHVCAGEETELGLYLTIPEQLKKDFKIASDKRLLMRWLKH